MISNKFSDKIKKTIRQYPGIALALGVGQLFLSVLFLCVIFFQCRTVEHLRTSSENRAAAEFSSDLRQLEAAAEAEDLTEGQKRMIFYGKSNAAVNALAETGYGEEIKRTVTAALNGICRHMLEDTGAEELLSAEEMELIRLLNRGEAAEACRIYGETYGLMGENAEVTSTAERKVLTQAELHCADKKKAEEGANRLFGVRGVLSEEKGPWGGTYCFSCKNAYAVMSASDGIPLEAAFYLSGGDMVYTAEECYALAARFVEEAYPRRIYRKLNPAEELEGEGYGEVVFSGSGGERVRIRISKANGRLVFLSAEGIR